MDSSSNRSTADIEFCQRQLLAAAAYILIGLIVFSVLILIILCFVQRRKRLYHKCLWGYPGIPIPMDFLISPRYRFIYIIMFGLMSTSLVSVFMTINSPPGINFYVAIVYRTLLIPLVLVVVLSVLYFPLFACVSASIPLLGHILGLTYSIVWFIYSLFQLVFSFTADICSGVRTTTDAVGFIRVASVIPIIGGSLLVVIWYGYKVVQGGLSLCNIPKGKVWGEQAFVCCGRTVQLKATDPPRSEVKSYHILRVKALLAKRQEPEDRGKTVGLLLKAVKYVIPFRKDFRLPLPFVGAVFAMSMLLYQLSLTVITFGATLAIQLPPLFNNLLNPLLRSLANSTIQAFKQQGMTNFTPEEIQKVFDGITDLSGAIFVGIPAFTIIAPLVSLIFSLFLLINMVGTVSKQLKRIAREGFKVKLPGPARRVTSSWKYVGYLIGFFVLAWVIYTLIVFIVLIAVAIAYLGFKYLPDIAAQVLLYIAIPLIWSQLVLLAQNIICRLIFFQDQKGKFIAIKNSRLFNWFAFGLFFYNGIAGFISAILRTVLSSIFSLILLFRLDQVVLLRGFEQFDFGHGAYLGFIYMESTYNNAVMHVFINLLVRSVHSKKPHSDLEEDNPAVNVYNKLEEDSLRTLPQSDSRRVRNRWLVAYTLVRNPSLHKFTASNLCAAKEGDGVPDKLVEGEGVGYKAPPVIASSTHAEESAEL